MFSVVSCASEQTDRWPGWSVTRLIRGIVAHVHARHCMPGGRSWTELAAGSSDSADRLTF